MEIILVLVLVNAVINLLRDPETVKAERENRIEWERTHPNWQDVVGG